MDLAARLEPKLLMNDTSKHVLQPVVQWTLAAWLEPKLSTGESDLYNMYYIPKVLSRWSEKFQGRSHAVMSWLSRGAFVSMLWDASAFSVLGDCDVTWSADSWWTCIAECRELPACTKVVASVKSEVSAFGSVVPWLSRTTLFLILARISQRIEPKWRPPCRQNARYRAGPASSKIAKLVFFTSFL